MESHNNQHTTPDQPAPEPISRRNFMKIGLGVLSAVAALEIGGAGLLFFKSRSEEGEFGTVINAGTTDRFPPGSVTEFTNQRFYLIRADDGGFLALHCRCPHLGCVVDWVPVENRFHCPCHASTFDVYGNFENTPVPRALDTFKVKIENQQVMVDTSEIAYREGFSPEELTYG